jgi:RimJ/RimL family protein N-acetyltransferase
LPVKILETERLILRELTLDDSDLILELLNEPDFIRHVVDRGVRTRTDATAYITDKILPSYKQFGFGFYLVELKDSGVSVGICGLIKRETLNDVDIGFSILRRFWRNGYAYEAAAALLNHGRNVLGLERIVGITSPENESSARLLEKLGLRFEKMIHLPGYGPESRLFSRSVLSL